MAYSVVNAVADRLSRINKALSSGIPLQKEDLSALREGYATPYSDKELALGRSESARPSEQDKWGGIPFIVTVLDEDRDGDIVIPKGYRGENYARNPVWFFGHQQWEIPIGTSRDPSGKIAVSVFPDHIKSTWYCDHEDEDADFVFGKVMRGILNATSIAFVPIEAVRRDGLDLEEHKARTHQSPMMPPGWRFNVWDHTETSIVGVPSNAGAIRDSLDSEKSFITPRLQKGLRAYAASAKGCWNGWCPTPGNSVSAKSVSDRNVSGNDGDRISDIEKGIEKGRRGGTTSVAAGTTGVAGERIAPVSPSKSKAVGSSKSKYPISSRSSKYNSNKISKAGTQADIESGPRVSVNPPPGTRPIGQSNLPPSTRSNSDKNSLRRQGTMTVSTSKDAADMRVEERDGLYYVVDPDINHVDGPYETEEEARHHIEFMVGEEATSPDKRPIPANRKDAEHKGIKAAQPSSSIDPEKACKILHDGEINGKPLTEAQRGMFGAACGKSRKSKKDTPDCYSRGVQDAIDNQKKGRSLKILSTNEKQAGSDRKLEPCYVAGWNSVASKNRITIKRDPIDQSDPKALRNNIVATLSRAGISPTRIRPEGRGFRITLRDQDWDKAFEIIDDNFDDVSTSLGDIMVRQIKDTDSIEKADISDVEESKAGKPLSPSLPRRQIMSRREVAQAAGLHRSEIASAFSDFSESLLSRLMGDLLDGRYPWEIDYLESRADERKLANILSKSMESKSLLESSGVNGGYTVGGMTDEGHVEHNRGSGKPLEDIHTEAFTACPECHGTGKTSDGSEDCSECNGIGMVEKANNMTPTIYRIRIGKKAWLSKAKEGDEDKDQFTTDEDDAREFEDQDEAATKAEDVGGEVEGTTVEETEDDLSEGDMPVEGDDTGLPPQSDSQVEGEGSEEGQEEAKEEEETPEEESQETEQEEQEEQEQEVPFEPKHSARVMAHTYAHMKALHDYLAKELARMDNPDARTSLEDHIAKYVQPAMEHIKELVGHHHSDHNLDEMVKAIESDTGGVEGDQNLEGEAGLVNEGHVPPPLPAEENDIGAGDAAMSDIEATGTSRNDDVVAGLQREEPDRPFDASRADNTSLTNEHDMSEPRDIDTDTEEIMERYQTREGKWMTRKAGVLKRTKNGKAFIIHAKEKGILNPGDREEEDAEELKGVLNPGDREETDAEKLKGILNPGDREETDAEELKGIVEDTRTYLKDMAEDVDIPKRHKAPLKYHTKRLGTVHKALTDMGKVQHSGGKGSPLTDEGTAGNKGSLRNMGEQQGKTPPSSQGRGNPGSTKSTKPATSNGTPAKSHTSSITSNGNNGSNGRQISSAVEEAANRLISKFEQTTGIRLTE